MLKNKKSLILLLVIILLSIVIALSNYIRIPIVGLSDFIKYAIHFIILCSSIIGLLTLSLFNRYVFSILAPIILIPSLVSALTLYFYNITITSEILEVTLKTDWSISKEFIDFKIIAFSIILIIIILFLIIQRFTFKLKIQESLSLILMAIILMAPATYFNTKRNGTIINRAPYSIIAASKEYKKAIKMSKMPRKIIAKDAISLNNDSLKVILILGESLRNDHLGINNYYRNTTPKLKNRDIYSLKNTKSVFTYTAASIPQILTRADSSNTALAYSEESIIHIFKRAGYQTSWFANQVPDYTYSSIVNACDHIFHLNATTSTYSDLVSTDQNILDCLHKNIKRNSKQAELYILHSIGSHWYYNYRYPEEMTKFSPTTASRSYTNNSKKEMINSYDNSVIFTDYFIDETIKLFENENAILIYISDHGECLGENDIWLHAFKHEILHNVACLVWMSEKYKMNHPNALNIKKNITKKTSTSHIFHTLLDAGKIKTNVFEKNKSLLSEDLEGYH